MTFERNPICKMCTSSNVHQIYERGAATQVSKPLGYSRATRVVRLDCWDVMIGLSNHTLRVYFAINFKRQHECSHESSSSPLYRRLKVFSNLHFSLCWKTKQNKVQILRGGKNIYIYRNFPKISSNSKNNVKLQRRYRKPRPKKSRRPQSFELAHIKRTQANTQANSTLALLAVDKLVIRRSRLTQR